MTQSASISAALAAPSGGGERAAEACADPLGDEAARAAFEHCAIAMLVLDAASGGVAAANLAARRGFGYRRGQLGALECTELFRAAGAPALLELLRAATADALIRLQQRCQNGSERSVDVSCQQLAVGGRAMLVLAIHDVQVREECETEAGERHRQLTHLALHDQLTGLPNRLFLAAHLPGAIEEARVDGSMLAVLFLDLDRFKHVNDSRGHATGDILLKVVAQRLRSTVRADDLVVRMGGDEFVVVLKRVKQRERIAETAMRINEVIGAPMIVDGRTLVSTVSIGVALYPQDGADMSELLRHSDTAMYQAKDRGRNNFQLFTPRMARRLRERIAIESSLRVALKSGQLDVHYQPIVDITSQRLIALEALLRWKHPGHGYVRPDRFVAIAEEAGLIVPLGDFVLQRAMHDMVRWRQAQARLVPVAINVSAVQLQRSDLAESIARLSAECLLPPSMLQIELTESAVFERREGRTIEANQDAVARLRTLGIRIAIDDFGTGYSSLSYLKRWRVDTLKIDRSFVRDLVSDPSDLAIVSAIIAMARHLHIKVVAEGIETRPQLERLRELGCSYAQGHLIARPMPAQDCLRHLAPHLPLTEAFKCREGEQPLDARRA